MTDKILIPDYKIACRVGVPDEERAELQDVYLDVELRLDLSNAGRADDFDETVDYDAICETVHDTVTTRPRRLIETIAEEVAEVLLANYPLEGVTVRCRKPGALRHRGIPYAQVEVDRNRDG